MVAESLLATREMLRHDAASRATVVFEVNQLQHLIDTLQGRGFEVLGPILRDGAIVYAPIQSVSELPQGWIDEQAPGRYRLKHSDSEAYFGYSAASQSWKRFLHPPEIRLWAAERHNGEFHILNNETPPARRRAFLGVRACELAAIAVQDRVLLNDRYRDPIYGSRRSGICLIAVQCTRSTSNCFCSSMQAGPAVGEGADLVLTELWKSGTHRFLAKAATEIGRNLLEEIDAHPATSEDLADAEAKIAVASRQSKNIDSGSIQELFDENFDHSFWETISSRCLACANCTMVCPTCFCTTVEDTSDVTGNQAERWRRWDSCFTQSFSYIHGGSIRTSTKSRFRQWMTHKLAAWIDQFGSSGCVGCGRCITWCPAGIDITEGVRALREGGKHGNS